MGTERARIARRAGGVVVTRIRRLVPLVITALTLHAWPLGAQWRDVTTGSEADLYIRALQTRGVWNGEPVAIRGYGPRVIARFAAEKNADHPWAARFPTDSAHFWLLRPMAQTSFNSAFPWGFNDGAVWQGQGATMAATAGFGLRWRRVSLRVEPVVFIATNGEFQLLGDTTRGVNPFVDEQRPGSIDLPQRFGRGS